MNLREITDAYPTVCDLLKTVILSSDSDSDSIHLSIIVEQGCGRIHFQNFEKVVDIAKFPFSRAREEFTQNMFAKQTQRAT